MKKLTSTKINLPVMYLLEDTSEIKDLPLGIPFIIGKEKDAPLIIKYLEYTVLYRSAKATGLGFNWEKQLSGLGYAGEYKLKSNFQCIPYDYMLSLNKVKSPEPEVKESTFDIDIDSYLTDGYLVSFDRLTELNVTPSWLSNLVDSIRTNVLSSISFNPSLYSKKLGMMSGYAEVVGADRNLGILDFSGSIPISIITTTALLAKLMSRTFYADIMITGSYTKLFKYEELDSIDLLEEAYKIGRNNDQKYFKDLVSKPMAYNVVFSFGDDDSPGHAWQAGDKYITDEEGKALCNWDVHKVISMHTRGTFSQTGYTRWFSPKETELVSDWLVTIKK
jgi:hypothetical protein